MSDAHLVGNAPLEVAVVVRDPEVMNRFYRDVLGLEHVGELEFIAGTMQRYAAGDGVVKLVALSAAPGGSNPPNGMMGDAAGLRYLSVIVDDLDAALARVEAAGGAVPVPKMEFEPGLWIAIVEDPEGTWVELVAPRSA